MGLSIQLEASYLADVDGTKVMGRCSVLHAADRLNYAAEHSRTEDVGVDSEVITMLDRWVSKTLTECDATINGLVYSKQPPDFQPTYVSHLPMEVKAAIISAALGLGELTGGAAKNSQSGPESA